MTPTEKAKAKEQASRMMTRLPEPEPVIKPRADKGLPRGTKTLPKWIYRRHYISGDPFYVVMVKRTRASIAHHVGSFATVPEAVRRLAQWLERNPV